MGTTDAPRHWTLGAIAQEALLNFAAMWPLSIVIAAILAILMTLSAVNEARTVDDNLRLVEEIEAGGGNVLVAVPASSEIVDGSSLDSRMCGLLTASPSVVTAGSVGAIATQQVEGLSVASATTVGVSPGALAAMWPSYDREAADLLVPREFAEARGLYPGSRIMLGARSATVSAVFDSDLRVPNRSTTILEVVANSDLNAAECFVETTWASRSTLAGTLAGVLSGTGGVVQVSPLRSGGVFGRSPHEEFTHRWTRLLWLWMSAGGGLLVFLASLGRRSQVGLYRSLGMRRLEATLLVSLDTVLGVTSALVVTVVGLAIWSYVLEFSSTAFAYGLRSGALSALGIILATPAATALATVGTVGDQLKER